MNNRSGVLLTFLQQCRSRYVLPVFIAAILFCFCGRAAGQYTCTINFPTVSPGIWTVGTVTLSPPVSPDTYPLPLNVFFGTENFDPLDTAFTDGPGTQYQLNAGESVATYYLTVVPLAAEGTANMIATYWLTGNGTQTACGYSTLAALPSQLEFSLDGTGDSGGNVNGTLSVNPPQLPTPYGAEVSVYFTSSNTTAIDPSQLSSPTSFSDPSGWGVFIPAGGTAQVSFPLGQVSTTQLVTVTATESTATGKFQIPMTVSVEPQIIPEVNLGPCSQCEALAGAPLNVTTGNVWITQNDYSLPGLAGGIQVSRTWNSMLQAANPPQLAGMFGSGWRSSYEESLQTIDLNHKKYWRNDGSGWDFTYNGTVYSLAAPTDTTASLAFNTTTSVFTLTFADGTQKLFDINGHLTTLVDRNNNQTKLTYDGSGRLAQVTDAASRSLTFTYGDAQNINQATIMSDSTGTVASFVYDASSRLTSVTYPDNSGASFLYDTNSFISSVLDPQGKVIESHTYDSTGRGLTSANANGVSQITMTYASNTTSLSDSLGNMSTYQRDRVNGKNYIGSIAGTGCSTCGGRGNWSYSYDAQGHRTQAVDPLNHFTNYTYDAKGNVLEKLVQRDSANDTQNWNYTYNSFNEVLTATDPLGNVTTNTYDAKGNMLTTTTPSPGGHTSGSKTTFTYDSKGELTKITDPLSNSTTLAYNSVGLVSSIADAQSKVTQFQYDAQGNRTLVIDALNQQTTFTYDTMNRITKITYPTSPATSTQFAYDYRGRKISVTDPNGKITQYAYDDADRLLSVTDPNSAETQYAYDNESNLTSITDASGNKTSFVYDSYGHVTQANFPSSFAETYSYDLDGNLLTKTDRNGHVINYGYDFLNRLTSKSYPDSTAVNYTYDLANRLTQVSDPTGTYGDTYDNMGRLTQTSASYAFISGKNFAVGFGYDAASNRTSMTDPQSASTAYVYDTLNRMTTFTYPSRTNYTFTYDALGRRTQLSRPNTVASNYQYDTLSRLTGVLHQISSKSGTTTLDGATYIYDAAGNRTSKTDKRTNVTSTFSYDPLYELTQVLQGTSTTESYSYDGVGNRLSSLGVSPYAYNTSNQLASYPGVTYTYDNNGNTLTKVTSTGTTRYAWDFENRLASVTLPGSGGTVSFKYDPFGRRIEKTSSSGTTNYVYDGSNVLEEVDGSGNVLARYVQGSGIDQPLAETRASTTSYYQADGLGSITSLSSSSGALVNTYGYDSYGKVISSSGTITNPYTFTGRESDSETGLYYYRARYYDPGVGRFVGEDPIGFAGKTPNFYAYANNSPTKYGDPFGEQVGVEGGGGAYMLYLMTTMYLKNSAAAAAIIKELEDAPELYIVNVNDSFPQDQVETPNYSTIDWKPHQALCVKNGVQSPALQLLHEMEHVLQHKHQIARFGFVEGVYSDLWEQPAVQATNPAAAQLGEPTRGNYYDAGKTPQVAVPITGGKICACN